MARARRHDSTTEAVVGPAQCQEDIVRENENEDYRRVHEEPMRVLENQREAGLAVVVVPRLAHRASDRVEEKCAVVGFTVVVAGRAEAQREDENQKRGRERPPRGLDIGGVKGREVWSPFVVDAGPRGPRRIDREAAQDERSQRRPDPPGVASQRCAKAPFFQVANGCVHSETAAMVSLTASADFFNADCSSAVSFTSTICSIPFFPSLHGTPQYIPDSPYSPSSHAAHGSSRF